LQFLRKKKLTMLKNSFEIFFFLTFFTIPFKLKMPFLQKINSLK
jgi:hypothetical protein